MSERAIRHPAADQLACAGCGATASGDARFCPDCGLPLVHAQAAAEPLELEPSSELHRRARLIKPQLAEGRLTKVAWVANQAEGEFIQSLLLEAGVPSLLRRTAGFDVPDMLFAGPRDVMVPAAGVDVARETLLAAAFVNQSADSRPVVTPWRLALGMAIALALGALIVWALYAFAR